MHTYKDKNQLWCSKCPEYLTGLPVIKWDPAASIAKEHACTITLVGNKVLHTAVFYLLFISPIVIMKQSHRNASGNCRYSWEMRRYILFFKSLILPSVYPVNLFVIHLFISIPTLTRNLLHACTCNTCNFLLVIHNVHSPHPMRKNTSQQSFFDILT